MSLASHIKDLSPLHSTPKKKLGKIAPVHLEDWVGVAEQQLQRRPRKRAGTLREDRLGVDGDQVRTKAPQGEDKIAAEDGTGIMWEFPCHCCAADQLPWDLRRC